MVLQAATQFNTDMRSAIHIASSLRDRDSITSLRRFSIWPLPQPMKLPNSRSAARWSLTALVRSFSIDSGEAVQVTSKPPICTADELHYVTVPNSDWRLALWRYHPNPQAPLRNHPLLLLSGVGTNAIGYDLSPESSFARYMSGQGFDTWILEMRGAGLSLYNSDAKAIEHSALTRSAQIEAAIEASTELEASVEQPPIVNDVDVAESDISDAEEVPMAMATMWDDSKLTTELTETFMLLSERLSGFLSETQLRIMSDKLFDQISRFIEDTQLIDRFNEIRVNLSSLLESRDNSSIAGQIRDLSEKLVNIIEEGQRSVSPQLFDLQERFTTTIEDFQNQLDLILKYDWDFDHYLDEDVPAAMEYVKSQCKPKDGKLLAIGHSMGGILLYAMLSRCVFEGRDSSLAAVVTLASSLDYTSSKSSLKLLLPLADPAQSLNVPVVPLGALLSAAYPLSSRPPYILSWLNNLISAENMMHPELLKKLVLNNFCEPLLGICAPSQCSHGVRCKMVFFLDQCEKCAKREKLRQFIARKHFNEKLRQFIVPLYQDFDARGCTVPAKLLLQLTTAFRDGGLCNRSGTFFYKDHLARSEVPVLAVAGDQDLICPPEAVYETVKLIPEDLVTFKVFGDPGGPHYAHYDLVGGRLAVDQVYPCIVQFLNSYD